MNEVTELTLFLGSEKGFRSLEYLASRKEIVATRVHVSRDSGVTNDYSKEISSFCMSNGIPVANGDNFQPAGYAISIGYRQMIQWTPGKLIVMHDSLLPKYRGFAPLPSMLENGENRIGVTAFLATDMYDQGKVIAQSSVKIRYPIKVKEALNKNLQNYFACLDNVIPKLQIGGNAIKSKRQVEWLSSYSLWRDESDYEINWNQDALRISRFVDAVGEPYSGARTKLEGRAVLIHTVKYAGQVKIENREPGKVIWWSEKNSQQRPTVVCGKGLLDVLEATYLDTGESIFPTRSQRIRFG
jgi:methionyl-tRNA formyltransferase